MTHLSLTAVILSILLLPVNVACAFWLFREALKLCGMTVRDFLDQTEDVRLHSSGSSALHRGRHRRRRYEFVRNFLRRHSADPETSVRLFRHFAYAMLLGLAALLLASYAAMHPERAAAVLVGDAILAVLNAGLYAAGRIYGQNHRLDAQTEELLESRRKAQKPTRRNLTVYALMGVFFFLILLGFHLGMARVATPAARSVDHTEVNSVLTERGFETADIPTTFWEYDENKLMYVCAGVKGKTKFEFYEYMDGETTDLVFNSISYQVAPELEPRERDSHITELPAGNRVFTVRIDGISHLVMYQNNTVVYAYSSGSMEEVQGILTELGYLEEKPSP